MSLFKLPIFPRFQTHKNQFYNLKVVNTKREVLNIKNSNSPITYTISEDKKIIDIHHLKSNTHWYVTNTPNVLSILKSNKTHFTYNNNGRLRLYISYGGKYRKEQPYFSDIIYSCYHKGVNAKSIYKLIPYFSEWWNKDKHIDHLDENKYNNCIYNLSSMSLNNNNRKRKIRKVFKQIFNLTTAFDGDKYRIQFSYLNNKGVIRSIRIICKNDTEFIETIEYIIKNKWQIYRTHKGVVNNSDMYSTTGKFPFIPIIKANYTMPYLQEMLVNMPLNDFIEWGDKILDL